jgi:homoserine trans-succinylase
MRTGFMWLEFQDEIGDYQLQEVWSDLLICLLRHCVVLRRFNDRKRRKEMTVLCGLFNDPFNIEFIKHPRGTEESHEEPQSEHPVTF